MTRVAIGLGANLGQPERQLHEAVRRLGDLGSYEGVSSIYATEAIGPPQPDYLNLVVILETDLTPQGLMEGFLAIEESMGRERGERWGPRVIDLDLLLFGNETINEPSLRVPHPRMLERRFVLEPLREVWPEAALPDGRRVSDSLPGVADQRVERVTMSFPADSAFSGKGGWFVFGQNLLLLALLVAVILVSGSWGAWTLVGALFLVAGAILWLAGVRVLGRSLTPYPAPVKGGRLADSGVYSLVRHPIYGGALVGALGLSLLRSSWPALAITAGLGVLFWFKSAFEERLLEEAYPSYGDYRQRVRRRLIPWVL
ncbi:MAG: 2-amino-4-hydroxy-6-hydroxymethyldihydropteridine diphosphokinase [Acidimicrobiia bacterium]